MTRRFDRGHARRLARLIRSTESAAIWDESANREATTAFADYHGWPLNVAQHIGCARFADTIREEIAELGGVS